MRFITSCCKRPIKDCPGCPQGMHLINVDEEKNMAKVEDPKYYDKLKQLEESCIKVIAKIDNKDVTTQDFASLIEMRRSLNESTPSSIRDRVRRRMSPSNKANRKKHDQDGHRSGVLNVAGRVQPKRKPSGQAQMNGRGKTGHRHSTRKQRRNAAVEVEDKRSNIVRQINNKLSEQITKLTVKRG